MMMQLLEAVSVILAVAYLLLATRENIWCWFCAFLSSFIYVYLFWQVGLIMESMLNVFYVVMAIVGCVQWQYGGVQHQGVQIKTLASWKHMIIMLLMVLLAWMSGWILESYTPAAWPYLDSFTTCASIITTFMVVYKILENWIYWFVIDAISIYLYLDRGLYLTAALFLMYLIIVVYGFYNWRQLLNSHQTALA